MDHWNEPKTKYRFPAVILNKNGFGWKIWLWPFDQKLVQRRSYIIHHVDIWPLHFKFPSCNVPIVWIVKSSYESNYSCLVKLCHKWSPRMQSWTNDKRLYNIFVDSAFSRILLNFHMCMCPSECNNYHMTLRLHVPRCPCFYEALMRCYGRKFFWSSFILSLLMGKCSPQFD